MTAMAQQATTPPHHPTFNIHLSTQTISSIAEVTFPELHLVQTEQLPSGRAFNNRVYFLTLERKINAASEAGLTNVSAGVFLEQVLKVSGRGFGPSKVRNEVSCLLLLERCCPDVPVPRALSYSADGKVVYRIHRDIDGIPFRITEHQLERFADQLCPGWVLLSRVSGRVLRLEDLQGATGDQIMRQLARYKAECRLSLPLVGEIGNVRLFTSDEVDSLLHTASYPTFAGLPDCRIDGLLLCSTQPSGAIRSSQEYYRHRLNDQTTILRTEEVFAPNRSRIGDRVRKFMMHTLPKLLLSRQVQNFAFTHYDFSPRNVLVTQTPPPRLTGFVDFEFAGFFPSEEDFVNDAIDNQGDWPESSYSTFLDELEVCGVKTPLRGMPQRIWNEAIVLRRLTENISPWRLRLGGEKGHELREALDMAAKEVERCIDELERIVGDKS